MKYKVSIIIPVHNGEKYLEEVLKSIKNQTIGFNNIEVIIVSDGSTDKTDKIAKAFVNKKENCHFFRNDIPSGAAGLPRNIGLENATGEYLMFIDADDFFEINAVEKMYQCINNTDYNFITTNYKVVDKDGKFNDKYGFDPKLTPMELAIEDLLNNKIYCNGAVWNKIFRTDFVKGIKAKFLEGDNAEDLYFTMCCLLESKKILFEPQIMSVNYRHLDNSASNNITYKYFIKINNGYLAILNKFKEYNVEKYSKMILGEARDFFVKNLIESRKIDNEQFSDVLDRMNWYFEFVKDVELKNESIEEHNILELILNQEHEELLEMRNYEHSNERY